MDRSQRDSEGIGEEARRIVKAYDDLVQEGLMVEGGVIGPGSDDDSYVPQSVVSEDYLDGDRDKNGL